MGEFVNGLLGTSSVNKMAEAMQTAPRTNPRDMIDRPMAESERQPPQQGAQQATPPEPSPEEQEAAAMQQRAQGRPQGQAAEPFDGPILSESGPDAQMDPRSGAALPPPSPEEEKQARTLMANVTDFLYGDGLSQTTKMLKQSSEVPQTVGEATSMLVSSQMDAAEAAGKPISPNILMSVGAEVVNQIYELAAALGVWAPQDAAQADKDMGLSLNYAANLFVGTQVQTGRKDRLTGITDAMEGIQSGAYDSQPGQALTNDMAPVSGPAEAEGLM